ncbi:MAG: Zn-ribbon domain-containing OB-fold protein [Streptosporangiaceae bacterium]
MAIIPGSTDLTAPYWDAARRHALVAQRCGDCGRLRHPPLPRCPACRGADVDWIPLAGDGFLYTYTVVWHPTHAALRDRVPYVVALVELAEGPRVVANILDCPVDEVSVGMPVRVTFEHVADGVVVPQFVPTSADGQ